jgi:hypothetical protein
LTLASGKHTCAATGFRSRPVRAVPLFCWLSVAHAATLLQLVFIFFLCAGGCCFDFHREQQFLFVVGAEDGSLYKCSTAFTTEFLQVCVCVCGGGGGAGASGAGPAAEVSYEAVCLPACCQRCSRSLGTFGDGPNLRPARPPLLRCHVAGVPPRPPPARVRRALEPAALARLPVGGGRLEAEAVGLGAGQGAPRGAHARCAGPPRSRLPTASTPPNLLSRMRLSSSRPC